MNSSGSGKQFEDQIYCKLEKVLDDEDLKDDCNTYFIDEDEPSFFEDKTNKKNILQTNRLYECQKVDKFRHTKHLEDLNYINKISITLSTHSANTTGADCFKIKEEVDYNEEAINIEELKIENLIIENNLLDDIEKCEINCIDYNNILKLSDRIDKESFNRLKPIFVNIINSQNGSKMLQKCLEKTKKNILRLILDEVTKSLSIIFSNINSNEFCQIFFSYLDSKERKRFISELNTNFVELSRNKFTSNTLYIFITQIISSEEKTLIVACIRDNLLEISYDSISHRILDKILSTYDKCLTIELKELIYKNFVILSNHPKSSNFIKKFITCFKNAEDVKLQITNIIKDNFNNLVQNQNGNILWSLDELKFLINLFQNRFSILSMHKYSTQVIKRCFDVIKDDFTNSFIDEIIKNNRVIDLIKNNISNSIIQKTLRVAADENKIKLTQYVEKNIKRLGDINLIQNWKIIINKNDENYINDYQNLIPYSHPFIMNSNFHNQMFSSSNTFNNNYLYNNMYNSVNANRKNYSMRDYFFNK